MPTTPSSPLPPKSVQVNRLSNQRSRRAASQSLGRARAPQSVVPLHRRAKTHHNLVVTCLMVNSMKVSRTAPSSMHSKHGEVRRLHLLKRRPNQSGSKVKVETRLQVEQRKVSLQALEIPTLMQTACRSLPLLRMVAYNQMPRCLTLSSAPRTLAGSAINCIPESRLWSARFPKRNSAKLCACKDLRLTISLAANSNVTRDSA